MATVMQGAAKVSAKRSNRKVLADKTNATPIAGSIPAAAKKTPIKAETPATPVVVRGEDLLRSVVIKNLDNDAGTPQFGAPAATEATADVVSPQHGEVVDATSPVEVVPVSERLSSAWTEREEDEVTEVGEDDDSDCSVLVNVSSPGVNVVSPVPATSIQPVTPTMDFKWQCREVSSMKVKEQDASSYYGDNEEYDGCDEYDEDYDGEVIDCEDICQGISRMGVAEAGLPEHKGRHIRFNYNSDDEIDVEEVDGKLALITHYL